MPLNFNTQKVDQEEVKTLMNADGSWNGRAEIVVYTMMRVGVSEVTDKTVDELSLRCGMLTVCGEFMAVNLESGKGSNITRKEWLRLRGLTTNVSDISQAAFRKSLMERVTEKARDISAEA